MKISEAFSSSDSVLFIEVKKTIIKALNERMDRKGRRKKTIRFIRLADVFMAIEELCLDLSYAEIKAYKNVISNSWFYEDNDLLEQSPVLIKLLHKMLCPKERIIHGVASTE